MRDIFRLDNDNSLQSALLTIANHFRQIPVSIRNETQTFEIPGATLMMRIILDEDVLRPLFGT